VIARKEVECVGRTIFEQAKEEMKRGNDYKQQARFFLSSLWGEKGKKVARGICEDKTEL
jgi:hypothetical protein